MREMRYARNFAGQEVRWERNFAGQVLTERGTFADGTCFVGEEGSFGDVA